MRQTLNHPVDALAQGLDAGLTNRAVSNSSGWHECLSSRSAHMIPAGSQTPAPFWLDASPGAGKAAGVWCKRDKQARKGANPTSGAGYQF